jgi:hypothetical protein
LVKEARRIKNSNRPTGPAGIHAKHSRDLRETFFRVTARPHGIIEILKAQLRCARCMTNSGFDSPE